LESARVRPIQVFGKNQQFFVFCRIEMSNGIAVAVSTIYKCSDGARFNGITCEFKCPGRGRFAHSDYADKYFDCNWVNLRLVGAEQECPRDSIFDRKQRLCVRNPSLGHVSHNNNGNENPDDGLNAMPAAGRSEPQSSYEDGGSQEAGPADFQEDQPVGPLRVATSRPSRKH
jgi:Chitin binding Peritrophin-A domain